MKKQKKIYQFILISFILIIISVWALIGVIATSKPMPIIYTEQEIQQAKEYFKAEWVLAPEMEQQIADINSLYGKNKQIQIKVISGYGFCNALTQKVTLNPNTPRNMVAIVLAHEFEHLNWVMIEYKASFKAVIRLWESDSNYLRYQASLYANTVLKGKTPIEYDCTNLLVNYYKENAYEDN